MIKTRFIELLFHQTAFRRRSSYDSRASAQTRREQSPAMEHLESHSPYLHVHRTHGCCAGISVASSEERYRGLFIDDQTGQNF